MNYMIRRAVLEDAEAVADVSTTSWKTTYKGILPHSFLNSLNAQTKIQKWKSLIRQCEEHYIYVAQDRKGQVVGFCHGGLERTGEYKYKGELYAIYLYEEYQDKGIGSKLIQTLMKKFNEAGIQSLIVWVLKENPYRKFYEQLGAGKVDEKQIEIAGHFYKETAYAWEHTKIGEESRDEE
ncbi:GNAT family N-acetyltransferase [Halobacillus sp. A5]|uniref:GNAT family N-acetyltransferase n=1 Tax=Halobacillus sp. A5 TaxID=2880263 RepID=UPI0020A6494B|nr:GNAT family N-acetyltransferase [Halobacillus sp. A5]MCP3026464.1 GNAT family N-acetyltransferase [Halobacillus sp. A5]